MNKQVYTNPQAWISDIKDIYEDVKVNPEKYAFVELCRTDKHSCREDSVSLYRFSRPFYHQQNPLTDEVIESAIKALHVYADKYAGSEFHINTFMYGNTTHVQLGHDNDYTRSVANCIADSYSKYPTRD